MRVINLILAWSIPTLAWSGHWPALGRIERLLDGVCRHWPDLGRYWNGLRPCHWIVAPVFLEANAI